MTDPDVTRQWQQELDTLLSQNQRLIVGLHARGIVPEETSLLHVRFDCLIDAIGEVMGEAGDDFVLMARVRWQQKLGAELARIQQEGTRAVLGLGGTLNPSQVADLARETGMPGWTPRHR